MTSLYSDLEIDGTASAADVKRAYRRKAKQAHPDTPTGSPESFQRLTRAYLVLSDPARRQRYDATGDIDEQTVDNTLSQAVSIIIGAVMSAVDNYVKGASADPASVDLVAQVKMFVVKQIVGFENQKILMEKAQASLRDIAKRWASRPAKTRDKASLASARFLKQALDQQAAGTAEPLRKIGSQIETYKISLELLENSSFDPLQPTKQQYQPMTRTWTNVYDSGTT